MIPEDIYIAGGQHSPNDKEGCVMEWVSVKWLMTHRGLSLTEAWALLTDSPECTEPMIYRAAQRVNDLLPEVERQRLVPLIDRLMVAGHVADPVVAHRCRVRVACWAARSVLDQVRDEDREVCETAILTAEAWLRGEATEAECAIATYATSAAAAAASETAAYAAASATSAAAAAAAAAAYSYASPAAAYAASAAADAELDLVLWLDDLISQWEKARAEEGVLGVTS